MEPWRYLWEDRDSVVLSAETRANGASDLLHIKYTDTVPKESVYHLSAPLSLQKLSLQSQCPSIPPIFKLSPPVRLLPFPPSSLALFPISNATLSLPPFLHHPLPLGSLQVDHRAVRRLPHHLDRPLPLPTFLLSLHRPQGC